MVYTKRGFFNNIPVATSDAIHGAISVVVFNLPILPPGSLVWNCSVQVCFEIGRKPMRYLVGHSRQKMNVLNGSQGKWHFSMKEVSSSRYSSKSSCFAQQQICLPNNLDSGGGYSSYHTVDGPHPNSCNALQIKLMGTDCQFLSLTVTSLGDLKICCAVNCSGLFEWIHVYIFCACGKLP